MKSLFDKFAAIADADPNIAKVNSDIESIKSFEKDASDKGLKQDFIQATKSEMINNMVANAEIARREEITALEKETAAIRDQYTKKLINSKEGEQFFKQAELKYAGMTNDEIKDSYKSFLRGEISDPREIDVLAKYLKTVDSKSHEHMKKSYVERKLNEPWRVLSPDLFNRYDELQKIGYGQVLVHVKGDGKSKPFYQQWDISDLLK